MKIEFPCSCGKVYDELYKLKQHWRTSKKCFQSAIMRNISGYKSEK